MVAPTYENYRSIAIDFDVHKALTARLESPADNENEVLRRLLGLKGPVTRPDLAPKVAGPSWTIDGVEFPAGTEFRRRYKGEYHTARVEGGGLRLDGVTYDSPSAAAIAITGNSVNGWRWWECRLPGRPSWVLMDSLRHRPSR